jgi:superfamily I DNA/RNA helicase
MHLAKHSPYIDIIEHPLEHFRVLGPAGSGKTATLLERFRFWSSKIKDNAHGIVVVTYTKESAESLTAMLLPEMSAHRYGEPVYRYYDLAKNVLTTAGISMRTIVQMEELVLLDQILSSLPGGGRNGTRSGLRAEKYQPILLKLFRFLIQNGLNFENARTLINSSIPDERLADVPDIYDKFCERMQHERLVTDYNICWQAAAALEKFPDANPLLQTQLLLIDDFQDVDPGQFALLKELVPPSASTKVNVFGDPTAAHFRFKGTQHGYLMNAFPLQFEGETFYLPSVSAGSVHLGGALEALLEATLEEDARNYLPVTTFTGAANVDDSIAGDEERTQAEDFDTSFNVRPDEFNEVLHIAEQVKMLLADDKYQPHDIAVAAREKHRYDILLAAAFQYYGIPLETGRRRRSVTENFIVDLLTLLCLPDDEAAAGSLIASPFYTALGSHVGRPDDTDNDRPMGEDETAALHVYIDAIRKQSFAKSVKDFLAYVVKEYVLPIVRGSEETAANPALHAYLSRLLTEWRRYTEAFGWTDNRTEADLLRGFMSKCSIFEDSFAPLSPLPGRVGFYSCHELKGRTFPVVFLVGCSEMLFPTLKVCEGIIPYETIQLTADELFPERGIEFFPARSAESHLRDEFSLLMLALTRASQKLFISAPQRCGGGVETGPTSILYDSLPQEIREAAVAQSGRTGMFPPAVRWADHMVRAAGRSEDRFGEQPWQHIPGLSPVPLLWHAAPLQERTVHAKERPISQSSLRMIDACPRRYFYSKVLSLPEDESVAMRFGSLFHEVMRVLGEEFPAMGKMHGSAARKHAGRIIEQVLQKRKDAPESPLVEQSIRYYLEQMTGRFFEMDGQRSDDYTIRRVEEKLVFNYGECKFVGIVDRLDEAAVGRPVVIDYKTGKIKKTGAGIRKNVVESSEKPDDRDWQVPIYAYGVLSGGAQPPIVFSYYNIQAGEEPIAVSLMVDDAEPDVDPESLFAGGLKKRFAHLHMDEVKTCMDDAVRLAQSIFTPTVFFERTEEEDRCRYCSHRIVCKRGEAWN